MNKSILITGANSGLGKEAARQLAMNNETEVIYLACRNKNKAIEAKQSLEASTGRSIFEIIIMDVSHPKSVRSAVAKLKEPIDALIMNRPDLKTSSEDEFAAVIDGTFFDEKTDPMEAYGYIKYVAALWMSSEARKNPNLRLITMSPGFTSGTAVMNDLPFGKRLMFKYFMLPIVAPLKGLVHKLEKGAKRFVDGVSNDTYKSGIFYASKAKRLTGQVIDQSTIFPDLSNTGYQDNANEAIHRFLN